MVEGLGDQDGQVLNVKPTLAGRRVSLLTVRAGSNAVMIDKYIQKGINLWCPEK